MKTAIKASKLIPFLNQKNKSDLKFDDNSVIERKEMIFNSVDTIDEANSTVWGTISTQSVDRTGDVVVSAGCDTTEFQKIPSVYINHDYSLLPVAKCEEIVHGDKCIKAKIKFITSIPAVRNIFELVKAGALKGISVGFDSNEVILRGGKGFDDMRKTIGIGDDIIAGVKRIISKWKLYEFSIVSIPANAECFVKSLVDAKIEVDPELTKYLGLKDLKAEIVPATEVLDEADIKFIVNKGMEEVEVKETPALVVVETPEKEIKNEEEKSKPVENPVDTITIDVKPAVEEIKKEEVKPEIKRFINVISTKQDVENLIEKTVEARLRGRTRLDIKIK